MRAELEAHLEDKTADPVRIFPDMDGLPGTSVMGDCDDIRYLPGGDPDQILTLEPCLTASVNGQKISLLRAALWQREDGRQGLYCYLRVDT